MDAVQARGRILGQKRCKLPAGRRVFSQSGLRTDSIFGQVRDATVQVWTVGEGFGIGSEFRQTRSFFVGSSASVLTFWICDTLERAHGTSARPPSVLEHYATLTGIAFDFARIVVGRCTFSTPSRNSAVTFMLSASSGSVKLRRKVP